MEKPKIIERVDILEEEMDEVQLILPNKMDRFEIEDTPTLDSNALVTSDGIYRALAKKADVFFIDSQLSNTSLNPVANAAIKNELDRQLQIINNFKESLGTTPLNWYLYTTPGTYNFIVPENCKRCLVFCCGGGGSSGWYEYVVGNNGGESRFGNYVVAYGGTAGKGGGGSSKSGYAGSPGGSTAISGGLPLQYPQAPYGDSELPAEVIKYYYVDAGGDGNYSLYESYGGWSLPFVAYASQSRNVFGGGGAAIRYQDGCGGVGGYIIATADVSPGDSVPVTVGAGGAGYSQGSIVRGYSGHSGFVGILTS